MMVHLPLFSTIITNYVIYFESVYVDLCLTQHIIATSMYIFCEDSRDYSSMPSSYLQYKELEA